MLTIEYLKTCNYQPIVEIECCTKFDIEGKIILTFTKDDYLEIQVGQAIATVIYAKDYTLREFRSLCQGLRVEFYEPPLSMEQMHRITDGEYGC